MNNDFLDDVLTGTRVAERCPWVRAAREAGTCSPAEWVNHAHLCARCRPLYMRMRDLFQSWVPKQAARP